jgi:hypothetical protein
MTPRNLYLYLVCLIMLLVGIFATVQLVRSVVGLAYPDPSSYSFYGGYEEPGMFGGGPDEEQIEQEEDAAKDSERRYEILSMVTAGTTLLLAGGIFALHWRRAQAERSLPAAAPEVPAGPPVP